MALNSNQKTRVKMKYGGVCQCCYIKYHFDKLDVHHLSPISQNQELENELRNTVPMCKKCHRDKVHTQGNRDLNPRGVLIKNRIDIKFKIYDKYYRELSEFPESIDDKRKRYKTL